MATFKLSSLPSRYFEFEAPDNLKVLHIEPPKLKTMNRLRAWGKGQGGTEEAALIVSMIISKNKERLQISPKLVMEWFDTDQLAAFIGAFLGWVNGTRENDPN